MPARAGHNPSWTRFKSPNHIGPEDCFNWNFLCRIHRCRVVVPGIPHIHRSRILPRSTRNYSWTGDFPQPYGSTYLLRFGMTGPPPQAPTSVSNSSEKVCGSIATSPPFPGYTDGLPDPRLSGPSKQGSVGEGSGATPRPFPQLGGHEHPLAGRGDGKTMGRINYPRYGLFL